MLRCALTGLGYWGAILASNIAASPVFRIAAVCDIDASRVDLWRRKLGIERGSTNPFEHVAAVDIDAVFIATPLRTHHELALAALKAGKHVFVEKPLAATSAQAVELIEVAARRSRTLMVDHVFVYTPAVRKIRELVCAGTLGRVHYYDSVRVNLGLLRGDSNVLWDLAVHDLSILDYVFDERPVAIAAVGGRHFDPYAENIAYMTCFYDSGLMAHAHVNWLAPVKVRRILVGGADRTLLCDDIEPDEKIKVYDRGIDLHGDIDAAHHLQVGYRIGDMWAPRLERRDALQAAIEHFADCIKNNKVPITDGQAGLRTVALLELADRALREDRAKLPVSDRTRRDSWPLNSNSVFKIGRRKSFRRRSF